MFAGASIAIPRTPRFLSSFAPLSSAKFPPPRLPALSPSLSAFRVSPPPFTAPPPRTFPSLTLLCHSSSMSSTSPSSIYDLTVKDLRGNDVSLNTYQGKVLLIVNVASQCGLTTSNYTELADMYNKYKDQGLEILAFPCNQFGGQEPGTNEEIEQFACTRFKAEYPLFDKVDVNGSNAAPLFKFLKKSKGGLFGDSIKWNFTKFLVNKEGQVVERFAPTTSPSKIEKDVKKQLGIS